MKRCPKCNCEWPDAANFCPVDGGELVPIAPPAAPSEAATRVMPAASESPAPSSAPPASAATAPSKPEPGGKKRFSETAWFLAAQSPEDLGDVSVGTDAELATEKYIVEGELEDDVREKYSLRKGSRERGKSEDA